MKVTMYEGCQLFTFNRETREFNTIEPEKVGVRIVNGFAEYYQLSGEQNLIIVQALNIKNAAAKMLTILMKEKPIKL
jgi:hypothetical protein